MNKMVPLPSKAIVPERDADKLPILDVRHLGIDFGGLTAVDDFNFTMGRTEIGGLIGRTAQARRRCSTCLRTFTAPRAAPSCWTAWIRSA